MTEVTGLEDFSILHVHWTKTIGHRLLYERKTLIVALMRGGELIALGVNEVFPSATFLHAFNPEDITNVADERLHDYRFGGFCD